MARGHRIPGPDAPALEARHDDAGSCPGLDAPLHHEWVTRLHQLHLGVQVYLAERCACLRPKFPDLLTCCHTCLLLPEDHEMCQSRVVSLRTPSACRDGSECSERVSRCQPPPGI